MLAATLLAGLALASPAQAAVNFFDARVTSSGQFMADYGNERHSGNSRGFGTDGQMSISWRWELRTVTKGDQASGGPELESKASMFRRNVLGTSSLVKYNNTGVEPHEEPACEKARFDFRTDGLGDVLPGLKGDWVDGPRDAFGVNPDGFSFLVFGSPLSQGPPTCLTHTADVHGLNFYDLAYEDDMPIKRGAFNPRFDRKFSKTYSDSISLPLEHDGISPTYHTAQGSSTVEVRLERLSEKEAEKLNDKYKTKPVTGETDMAP